MDRIYLDHAATTPLADEAREAMLPWFTDCGNPSSLHQEGRRAKDAIDEAREVVSQALGCHFAEVVFTSSGTEAANLAILGAALANRDTKRNRILLGAAEHHCILHTRPLLERFGYMIDLIPVDRQARTSVGTLGDLLDDQVLLVSVMHANNEIGTINLIQALANQAHRNGALFHTDAVQTFSSPHTTSCSSSPDRQVRAIPRSVMSDIGADLISISAHKINGPKGVGALYQKAGVKLQPLTLGGGQEREMRAGTENVAGIAGFGAAVTARLNRSPDFGPSPRDHFLSRLEANGFIPTADPKYALRGHAHVRLPGVDAETMLIRLDRAGISASSGAACSSGSLEPSHVLLACGYTREEAKEGLRFTFGLDATLEQAEEAARRVIAAAESIRQARPAIGP